MYILFYSRYIFIYYLHPKQLNSRYSFITRTSSYLSSTVHRDRTQLKGVSKSKVPEITVMSDDGCSPFTSMVKIFLVLKSHRQEGRGCLCLTVIQIIWVETICKMERGKGQISESANSAVVSE